MASAVHISLNVSDLPRSTEFYRRFLGEPRKVQSDYVKFVSEDPEIHLALSQGPTAGPGPLSHLGIRLDTTEQVERWKNRLAGRGLETEDVLREACCYALQEKFRIADPDGTRWEVYAVLEDLAEKDGTTSAKSCCVPDTASCCAG
jgi:catechol 2,3-dioxygenase-like lactoylglutathione lyase family enzyme